MYAKGKTGQTSFFHIHKFVLSNLFEVIWLGHNYKTTPKNLKGALTSKSHRLLVAHCCSKQVMGVPNDGIGR